MKAFLSLTCIEVGPKKIPVTVQELDLQNPGNSVDVLYLFPDQKIPESCQILSFCTHQDQVKSGATIGMILKETVPKLVFNLSSMKKANVFFPSSLLNLCEKIE